MHTFPGTIDRFIAEWELTPEGEAFRSTAAKLMPVRWRGLPAMLKVSTEDEERTGHLLMRWWDGDGAARVYAHSDEAILLERATGTRSLSDYAVNGRDDEATRILCETVVRLHAPRETAPPELIPLDRWFRELWPVADSQGGLLARAAQTARTLLADPREMRVLHGDIHHGNVLDFGERGWLAIDPKRLFGERGFDYANIFCNPDIGAPESRVAIRPERFERRLAIVCEAAGLEPRRQLQWILAWAGLSAAWFLSDGVPPTVNLYIATLAAAALDR
ncbi:MAG: aminoglycoside phosphotransferase family protein [Shinella sp.]|nr:aminoglycoside phosphotransferase family protein [Shinella sp.]